MQRRQSSKTAKLLVAAALLIFFIVIRRPTANNSSDTESEIDQPKKMSFASIPGAKGAAGRMFGPIITYPAVKQHTASIIMLHGLGDTGNGWAPVAPELALHHIKFLFPTAPTRPITVNMGMSMPGWFDIDHLDAASFNEMMRGSKSFDPKGVEESVKYVNDLVEQEIKAGIPANRILIGGFSQGGHIALKAALQRQQKVAACAALSTWLEPSLNPQKDVPKANLDLPIFYGHGSSDPLIPAPVANASLAVLESMGCKNVEFTMYPGMQHSTCGQEMMDLKRFIVKVLPETSSSVSRDDVLKMSARELKEFLLSNNVSPTGLLEKQELVEKALSLL